MKLFLKKIFLFSLVLLIIFIIIEVYVRTIPNDYSYKNKYLGKYASEIEVFSLGSSHGLRSINPSFISKRAFNGGHSSQSLSYDYLIWKKFKDSMIKLDVLILPISYFSLFSEFSESVESWRVKNYTIYYGFPPYNFESLLEISNTTPSKIFQMIKNFWLYGITNLTIEKTGISLRELGQVDLEESGLRAAQLHTEKNNHNYEKNLWYLTSIIEDCLQMGVRIILVTTPTYDYYWKNLDAYQLGNMYETVNKLSDQFDHVFYFNFLTDNRFDSTDFYDSDHLNTAGAEKFTKILNELLNSLK